MSASSASRTIREETVTTSTVMRNGEKVVTSKMQSEETKMKGDAKTVSSTERTVTENTTLQEGDQGLKKVTENNETVATEVTNYEKERDSSGNLTFVEASKRASIASTGSTQEHPINGKHKQHGGHHSGHHGNKLGSVEEEHGHHKQKDYKLPIVITSDEDLTLFAHNYIRKLHGIPELQWDDHLASEAKHYVEQWAQNGTKPERPHSSTTYGENSYRSENTNIFAKPYTAVHLWYQGIAKFDFQNPHQNSATDCATQLIWDQTTHVGLASAYREDIKTTYIVARYSPTGNDHHHSGSYQKHVQPPVKGVPPEIPKLEDLIDPNSADAQEKENAEINKEKNGLNDVLNFFCKWCKQNEEKPLENSWYHQEYEYKPPVHHEEEKHKKLHLPHLPGHLPHHHHKDKHHDHAHAHKH